MSCQINNPSNYDISEFEPHFNEMYGFFDQKIGFQEPPKLFLDSDPSNQSNVLGKTAYYDPSTLEIHVFVDGRHPKDLLRSIAHELIHHRQNLEGRLDVGGYMGDGYYLKNKDMRALEDEAMKDGNRFMREWEDTKKLEERNKMSLKEWKNNELNQLLLKKFGILKEEKEMSAKDKEIAARTKPKDKLNKGDFLPAKERAELNEEDCLEEACGDKKYMEENEGQRVLYINRTPYGISVEDSEGNFISIGAMVSSLVKGGVNDIFVSENGIDEQSMQNLLAADERFKSFGDDRGMAGFDSDVFRDYYNVDTDKVVQKYAVLNNYRTEENGNIEETFSARMNTPRDARKDQGRERKNEAANLQEMLNRMIKAKNIFINGKRVK